MTVDVRHAPPTIVWRRASFEGCNIRTWIGFKHLFYLMEEGVLEHLRGLGLMPRRLYDELGLCFEIVHSAARIHRALHLDDMAVIEVTPDADCQESVLAFRVRIFAERIDARSKILSGEVRAVWRRERPAVAGDNLPDAVRPYVVDEIRMASPAAASRVAPSTLAAHELNRLIPEGTSGLIWKRGVPYFYCHFSDRLQHSGYVRLLEEAVAVFLANRAMSIRTNLQKHGWIPFVSHAELTVMREVSMEETIYTAFAVDGFYKSLTYESRIDFYASRAGALHHTATGRITHGYGLSKSTLEIVSLDETTLRALSSPGVHYEV